MRAGGWSRRSWACLGLTVALAVAAAGCMIGPSFRTPPTEVAEAWIPRTGVDGAPADLSAWWTVLGDPTLTRLVALAYDRNLSLQAAGVRVLQARAQLGVAIGELWPQEQSVSAAATYNRIPISIPFNVVGNTYWQAAFGAQMGWELDLWGRIRRAVESADDAFLASVAAYDDALVTLIADVASTYVQIRVVEAQLAIAEQNLERQRKALEVAQARFTAGVVTKRDVYQALNVLGTTEAAIPELGIARDRLQYALSVLLGMPPRDLGALLQPASGIPSVPAAVAVGIPANLLRRRPDVRKAELDAAAQCAQIGVAKGDLLPALSLMGTVGTVATDLGRSNLGKVFSGSSLVYSAGPAVQWNVLNYGQITNDVRVQDAKFQVLLLAYQNQVLEAQQEVESGLAEMTGSRAQAGFLAESVAAAEGALRIVLLEYKEGTADFTAVSLAEQNLYEAQNDLAVAQGNVPLGLVKTYRALGGGWELRDGHDFVPEAIRVEMADRTDWGELLSPELLRPQAPGLPGPEDAGPPVGLPEW